MSTSLSSAGNVSFQGHAPADKVTTVDEARHGKSADGTAAPKDTTAVVVEPGDTISDIMAKYGLDWNDPADRAQFLRDNPQFADLKGGRNPDLIWPGEVVYVHTGKTGTTEDGKPPGKTTETRDDKKPDDKRPDDKEKDDQRKAANATDKAASDLEQAQKERAEHGGSRVPSPDGGDPVAEARDKLFDAVQKEIEAGLDAYMKAHPHASASDIRKEADRLRHEIQGRSATTAGLDDTSMDFRTQQAINNASARQHGIDLSKVAPGEKIEDGPYTDSHGPFAPDSRVKLADGTYVQTDENGWPDTDLDKDGKADPTTPRTAREETDAAASELDKLKKQKVDPRLQVNQDELIAAATTRLGNAIQREIELGLRDYIAKHPDATAQQIQDKARQLGAAIVARDGNAGAIPDSQLQFRIEQAIAMVTQR